VSGHGSATGAPPGRIAVRAAGSASEPSTGERVPPVRAGGTAAAILALLLVLMGCAPQPPDGFATTIERAASSTADPADVHELLQDLADIEPSSWWQPGGVGDEHLVEAASALARQLDELAAVAGAHVVGVDQPPREVPRDVLDDAISTLLASAPARDVLARATGAWVEERLPDLDELPDLEEWPHGNHPVDRDHALAGWVRAVAARLDDTELEVRRGWYRTALVGALDEADERARRDGSTYGLVIHHARASYADEDRALIVPPWGRQLEQYLVLPRWLQEHPDLVTDLTESEPPSWDGDEATRRRWIAGEDVSEHPDVVAFAEELELWAGDASASGTVLGTQLYRTSRASDPVARYEVLPDP
jgi:hypothetical protein